MGVSILKKLAAVGGVSVVLSAGMAMGQTAPEVEMVFVEGGKFTMGCNHIPRLCQEAARPPHSVTVSSFNIGKYEVTQKQWNQVMGKNRSAFKGDDLPVEKVSWDDVQEFIAKLNAMTGKKYRLPTEAEWEFAARGGNKSKKYRYSGSNRISDVAWYYDNTHDALNRRKTKPVGSKAPNELGIYDMSGNVREWVSDWLGDYTGSDKTNPVGPSSGRHRILRGGSFSDHDVNMPIYTRFNGGTPAQWNSNQKGFRLAHPAESASAPATMPASAPSAPKPTTPTPAPEPARMPPPAADSASAPAATAAAQDRDGRLVGTWTWTHDSKCCQTQFIFREDGGVEWEDCADGPGCENANGTWSTTNNEIHIVFPIRWALPYGFRNDGALIIDGSKVEGLWKGSQTFEKSK